MAEEYPEKWINNHFVQKECHHFLFGYRLYKDFAVPIPLYHVFGVTCFLGCVAVCFMYTDDIQVIFDAVHYALHMIVLNSCAFEILKYGVAMETINIKLDNWFHYRELEEETLKLRKEAEKESQKVTYPYLAIMFGCGAPFCLAPLLKLYMANDRSNIVAFFIFPCYLGLPLDTYWGYGVTYIFEVIVVLFAYTLYARLAAYTAVVNIHVNYQLRLMGRALATVEERSKKITKKLDVLDNLWEKQYEITLYKEIQRTAAHLEYLQGLSQVIVKIFTPATTTTYTAGMWLVCFSGVLLSTMHEDTELVVKFCILFCAELVSLYMYSLASEYLLTAFTQAIPFIYFCPWYNLPKPCCKILLNMMTLLRKVPSLRTMMGYYANKENLGQILNASYSYFSLIIAMKK